MTARRHGIRRGPVPPLRSLPVAPRITYNEKKSRSEFERNGAESSMESHGRPIRMTLQRQAVLDVVRRSHDHPTAMEIFERVRAEHPTIAYSTVYTALHALVEAGLVTEIRLGGHATRYDGRTEHHHHLVCTGCGRVVEVEAELCHCRVETIAEQTGFQVLDAQIELKGLCPECQSRGEPGLPEGHDAMGRGRKSS